MIISSPIAKLLSFVAATGILVGGMKIASPNMVVELEGSGVAVEAKMGTSFEDMAVGTLTAEPIKDITSTQTPPEMIEPVKTAQKVLPEPIQKTPQVEPVEAPSTTHPKATQAVRILATLPPQSPTQLAALAPSSHAVVPTTPVHPTPLTPAAPPETVTSQTPATIAPPQSMRPKRRDPEKAAKVVASRPKPKIAKQKSPRGNAKRNNTKGSTNGTTSKTKASSKGTAKQASAKSGNAAVSNYPGQVMRRINRVRKPRVNARGTATVAFSISSGGGLSGVSIARSSGSAALDKAAMLVIQKAAPFPKPPGGAKRRYTIRIKGR